MSGGTDLKDSACNQAAFNDPTCIPSFEKSQNIQNTFMVFDHFYKQHIFHFFHLLLQLDWLFCINNWFLSHMFCHISEFLTSAVLGAVSCLGFIFQLYVLTLPIFTLPSSCKALCVRCAL